MFRVAAAFSLVAIGFSPAMAEKMTDNQKMMFAASVALSAQMGDGTGDIHVGDDSARLVMNLNGESQTVATFKKDKNCVYEESSISDDGVVRKAEIIDFNKLNGSWTDYGREIVFMGSGNVTCFAISENIRRFDSRDGCHYALDFVYQDSIDSKKQVIDDVSYVLRHGCGDSVESDPDPH